MFMTFLAVSPENIKPPDSLSDNSPIIVGGTVGAFVVVITGVAFAIFVIRYVPVIIRTLTNQTMFFPNGDVHLIYYTYQFNCFCLITLIVVVGIFIE